MPIHLLECGMKCIIYGYEYKINWNNFTLIKSERDSWEWFTLNSRQQKDKRKVLQEPDQTTKKF